MIELTKDKEDIYIDKFQKLFSNGEYSPDNLLDYLDELIPGVFICDTGVWENYNLRKHTLMVLNQFEKYFGYKESFGMIDKNIFRLILGLHDIGKPFAIKDGNKKLQHRYNPIIVEKIFNYLKIQENHTKLAIVLTKNDLFGKIIKKHILLDEAKLEFNKYVIESGLNQIDYFKIQLIYYMVDAGSYTLDAGGKYSLDRLFIFDHKNSTLKLKKHLYYKLKKLI